MLIDKEGILLVDIYSPDSPKTSAQGLVEAACRLLSHLLSFRTFAVVAFAKA